MKSGSSSSRAKYRWAKVAGSLGMGTLSATFAWGCEDGSGDDSVCLAIGCPVNQARLSGTSLLAGDATVVHAKLCVDENCHEGSVDILAAAAGAPQPCLTWDRLSHVCVTGNTADRTVAIDVVAEFSSEQTPHDASVRLEVTDPDSGTVLLSEVRTARHEVTIDDGCRRCWQATASL